MFFFGIYLLVDQHSGKPPYFWWEIWRFQWPFSIAMLITSRGKWDWGSMDPRGFDIFYTGHLFEIFPRCEAWCWKIDLQNWPIFGENVGQYSSTMVCICLWDLGESPIHWGFDKKNQPTNDIFMRHWATNATCSRWANKSDSQLFPLVVTISRLFDVLFASWLNVS